MKKKVLILVLMEDTLRGVSEGGKNSIWRVLILVLMEDTLREVLRCSRFQGFDES